MRKNHLKIFLFKLNTEKDHLYFQKKHYKSNFYLYQLQSNLL